MDKSREVLMKYVGGLFGHLKRHVFIPQDIGEAFAYVHYFELDKEGKSFTKNKHGNEKQVGSMKSKDGDKGKIRNNAISTVNSKGIGKGKFHCFNCNKDGHLDERYWKLHPMLAPF